jgi:hypothetical protein
MSTILLNNKYLFVSEFFMCVAFRHILIKFQISTIGIESRLGTVMDHHLLVILKKLIQYVLKNPKKKTINFFLEFSL